MPDAITWNEDDVASALKSFEDKVARTFVRSALRLASAQALAMLRTAAPRRTGRLQTNIALRATSRQGAIAVDVVVNTSGKRDDKKNAFYWAFVDRGHKTRPSHATNPKPQHLVPATRFVENTWARLQQTISATFFQELGKAVNGQLTKQG
ncbi:MAG TPA: HK97-gp10 family putative phage morphogenesis protein [Steroidobacteraceae bacterium]|nr:HK97-gp10 family putative phage morphogenesis protein [Steroidobacteraceae bacterium]